MSDVSRKYWSDSRYSRDSISFRPSIVFVSLMSQIVKPIKLREVPIGKRAPGMDVSRSIFNHITAIRVQDSSFIVFQSAGIILSHLGLPNPDLGCLPENPRGNTSVKQSSKQTRRLIMHHCTPHQSKRRSFAAFVIGPCQT